MTEEVTPVVEPVVEPEVTEAVDLDANPVDGTLASTDAGYKAPAEEPPVDEATAEAEPAEVQPEEVAEAPAPERNVEVWGDTGSDVGNSVLGMLEDSGVSTDDAKALLFDAVQSGDVSKIDVAALTEKVGKHAANIILSGTKNFIAENTANTASVLSEVHTTAGSKENWDTASKWASANMPESTLAEYRPMIDKGGASARFAVSEVLAAYNADGNNSTIAPSTPRAEGTSVSPPASTATTRAEYFAALEKANRRGASPREIATIQADRNRGRSKGI